MSYILEFLMSVAANIFSHVLCKWVDKNSDDSDPK